MDNTGGMGFAELLAQPGVFEEIELRSRFGFLAFHGGPVERVTTMIARMAAERSGSSFYAIDQPEDRPLHIPSIRVDPAESPTLTRFYEHVDGCAPSTGTGETKRSSGSCSAVGIGNSHRSHVKNLRIDYPNNSG